MIGYPDALSPIRPPDDPMLLEALHHSLHGDPTQQLSMAQAEMLNLPPPSYDSIVVRPAEESGHVQSQDSSSNGNGGTSIETKVDYLDRDILFESDVQTTECLS